MQSNFRNNAQDVLSELTRNIVNFWVETAETPQSLEHLISLIRDEVERPYGNAGNQNLPRRHKLSTANHILMAMMWMRSYQTVPLMASRFGIGKSTVQRDLDHICPILHTTLFPREVNMPTAAEMRQMRGGFPDFPNALAILDGTPIRINRPKGAMQRLFYRGDKHYHLCNWLVAVDSHGTFRYSRPGFTGHLHDATCYRYTYIHTEIYGSQLATT